MAQANRSYPNCKWPWASTREFHAEGVVQNDRCVADLMPGWELAEILEGDIVIPANPRS